MKFITIKVLSSDSPSQKPSLFTKSWIKITKKQSSIKFIKKLYKIKIIFFTIVILLIYKFYKYCSIKAESENEENQNNSFMNSENDFLRYFQSLKNISYDNTSLLEEYRDNILKLFSKKLSKNITSIDNLYMDYYLKFGNHLAHFNKAIFYCEIKELLENFY